MNVKDKRGSITIFVLVGLVFMSSFLLISYANNLNKSKMAKEQYNIINTIYYKNNSDAETYNTIYGDIRSKNKQTLTAESTYSTTLTLTKTYEESVKNYRIYASTTSLGSYDSSTGKYQIQIKTTNSAGTSETSYNIYLSAQLSSNEYIDYKTQRVVTSSGTTKEIVSLPTIYTYEEYTKIQIVANTTPYKIHVEYTGYTL